MVVPVLDLRMRLVVRDNWRSEFTEAPAHQGCRFRLPLPGEAAPLSDPFYTPGDPEGIAAFFVALSRAKQRAIFTFCQQRGERNNVAELYRLLTDAGVLEITL